MLLQVHLVLILVKYFRFSQDFSDGFTILINNLQGYCSVYNKFGLFLGNLELNETFEKDFAFSILDIISSTGLQVKMDPGIPLIYTGFGFLMLSTLISYFTYSQIWVVQDKKKVFIGGNTTRAILDFELEFFELSK
jgi:cytochrome c biogenesis protein